MGIGILTWLTLFAVLSFFSPGAYAEEQYQEVLGGQYYRDDGDQGSRTIDYGLQGRIYFEPVKTDGHPYAEAPFLERIGSFYGVAEHEDYRRAGREGDGPVYTIGVNATKPHFPLAVDVYYTRKTRDYDPPSNLDVTNDTYSIRAGNFFADTWLAGLLYLYSAWDNEWASVRTTIYRQQQYGLFTKYDHDLGQNRMLSVQATVTWYANGNSSAQFRNTEESLQLDYYFTRSLSVGAGFKNSSGTDEDREGRTYSTDVQYYITRLISVSAGYSRFLNANDDRENHKSYHVSAAIRF